MLFTRRLAATVLALLATGAQVREIAAAEGGKPAPFNPHSLGVPHGAWKYHSHGGHDEDPDGLTPEERHRQKIREHHERMKTRDPREVHIAPHGAWKYHSHAPAPKKEAEAPTKGSTTEACDAVSEAPAGEAN
mmetsp:Transcript_5222/g.11713  ORF Transcript_5222/g.11713 Transcript_5222/m.11713 type:complete len:133 (+) Transcript_5222:115-513(+)|eukprot:CAMPEP_0182572672 /NCGR_PEP_ID=MMETSP1324-20130603/17826_1 /TAXON_ID=236786 /ORGANISM="Florenciella sp., Strain RCC1587" /LENGTH=132 /DNA_ID=CAMNT_0024787667 /DNA_START=109 /DNA_END=507 /DNA_ORIENTATION=-